MKKLAILLLALAMLLCLAACDKQKTTEPQSNGSTPSDSKPTPSDHSHSYTETVTAPTCTEGGYTTHICQCGETYQDAETPALGHTWLEATLEAPKTCSVCGTTEGKPLPDARFDPELCAPLFGTWEAEIDGHWYVMVFQEFGTVFRLYEFENDSEVDYCVYYVEESSLWVGEYWNDDFVMESFTLEGDVLTLDSGMILTKTSDSTQRPADPENKFDPAVCAPLFGTWEADMAGITMTYVFTDKGEFYGYYEVNQDRHVEYSTYFVVGEELHVGENWDDRGRSRFSIVDGTLTMYEEDGETVGIQMKKVSDNMDFVLRYTHTCEWEVNEVIAPTCNRAGYTLYTCSICRKEKEDDRVEPLPHTLIPGTEKVVAPTCSKQGYTWGQCTTCDWGFYFDPVEKLPHTWGTDGNCTVCNETCLCLYGIGEGSDNGELDNIIWGIGVDTSAQDVITTLVLPERLYIGGTVVYPALGDGGWTILNIHCPSLEKITIATSIKAFYKNAFEGCENLIEIQFQGTVEQWNAIAKGEDWDKNTGDYTVYCTDGEIKKGE